MPNRMEHAQTCQVEDTYRLHPLLDGLHQPIKVVSQRLQAARVDEQTSLARGRAGGARRGRASAAQGDLLVLAQERDLVATEAEAGVRDGVGGAGHSGSAVGVAGIV